MLMREGSTSAAQPRLPPPLPCCRHGPLGKAPSQKIEEGLGAHPVWEKVPTFLCFTTKSSPGKKRNGAGSLADRGHEGWECLHATGRGHLTEEGKALLQT